MAKQLLLIRHAKSDWANSNLTDFDRPLNQRGDKNAPEMVQRLVHKGIQPELIVSSPALRALTTAKYFAAGWKMEADKLVINDAIYEATTNALLKTISNFDDQYHQVALFGHNPGLSDLLNYLTKAYIANMPTCGVAVIEFPFNEWKLVSGNTGHLILFDYPKNQVDFI